MVRILATKAFLFNYKSSKRAVLNIGLTAVGNVDRSCSYIGTASEIGKRYIQRIHQSVM